MIANEDLRLAKYFRRSAFIILLLSVISLSVLLIHSRFWEPRPVFRSGNACVNNLRQLDGAKEMWAAELKKKPTDIPTDSDLIGTDKYIKVKPTCPQNGKYTYGAVNQKPRCSIAEHSFQ